MDFFSVGGGWRVSENLKACALFDILLLALIKSIAWISFSDFAFDKSLTYNHFAPEVFKFCFSWLSSFLNSWCFLCSISWSLSLPQERASLLHSLHCRIMFLHSYAGPPDTSVPRANGSLCKSSEYLLTPLWENGGAALRWCFFIFEFQFRHITLAISCWR